MKKTAIVLAIFFVLSTFLSGCAGTASGKSRSVFKIKNKQDYDVTQMDKSGALVVIRYPAMIEDNAKAEYVRQFAANAIGEDLPLEEQGKDNISQVAEGLLIKTNYYAMSLYSALREKLPKEAILLSPHLITYEMGYLRSEAVLDVETMPSVLKFDFVTYTYPDISKVMDKPPLTFGDVVTPLGVLWTSEFGYPQTNGLLIASRPLLKSSWHNANNTKKHNIYGRLNGNTATYRPPHEFIAYLNNQTAGKTTTIYSEKIQRNFSPKSTVKVYPVEKIKMDGDTVSTLIAIKADPLGERFASGFSSVVVGLLQQISADRALYLEKYDALKRIDPELASAFMARDLNPTVVRRLRLAEKILEAEKKFFAKQSEAIYSGVFDGSFGNQMRETIVAEYNSLEERRNIASKQNWNTALAVLSAATSAYASSEAGKMAAYDPYAAQDLQNKATQLMMSSIMTIGENESLEIQKSQIGENFLLAMAPALDHQISIQVESLEGKEEISAKSHSEFFSKLVSFYQKKVRHMDYNVSESCTFKSIEHDVTGKWFGACVNGLGEGFGYGLVADGNQKALRFIGEVSSGLPNGTGVMVKYAEDYYGGTTIEGNFKQGVPDGTVEYWTPGKKPQLRRYENGEDTGKGKAEELPKVRI